MQFMLSPGICSRSWHCLAVTGVSFLQNWNDILHYQIWG